MTIIVVPIGITISIKEIKKKRLDSLRIQPLFLLCVLLIR